MRGRRCVLIAHRPKRILHISSEGKTDNMTARPKLYIAGPYSADSSAEIFKNIMRAEKYARIFIADGWAVFTPHKNTAGFESYPELKYDDFIETDLAWLRHANCVFMLDGYDQSRGCAIELAECQRLSIPIIFEDATTWRFSMDEMLRFFREVNI
jgi:hypothetical protein